MYFETIRLLLRLDKSIHTWKCKEALNLYHGYRAFVLQEKWAMGEGSVWLASELSWLSKSACAARQALAEPARSPSHRYSINEEIMGG